MSIEALATAAMPPVSPVTLQAGYGAGLGDLAGPGLTGGFEAALARAGGGGASPITGSRAADSADAIAPALKGMFSALEKVNGEAKSVGDFAQGAANEGRDLTPGEIIQLTMRCHEFMFHCQLSSSIANRTSDGIQQLFKQQS